MAISDSIKYVGFDDAELEVFESQYTTEGISYNSYVILDDRTAIMDTVDKRGAEAYFENLREVLGDKKPSYLIIQHMEPDHAANIERLAKLYPEMKLVGTAAAGRMVSQFFESDMQDRFQAVKENDTLSLGNHVLQFIMAPMVHWPEVMVTYEQTERILFSADAFGTFGALENDEEWIADASHYYFNIVGKYGAQVQALLKKASLLDIDRIAPLHGPVLSMDLDYYIDKYQHWSTYTPEDSGILIAYASIHGNTKAAMEQFARELTARGEKVLRCDLTREHVSYAVENAFRYDRMILAACTYDGNLFPPMEDFLYHLQCKAFKNRKVGLVENGSWGPLAASKMKEYTDRMGLTLVDPVITIRTMRKPSDDAAFKALADAICQ